MPSSLVMLQKNGNWNRALKLADTWANEDRLPAIGLAAGTAEDRVGPHFFGRRQLADAPGTLTDDALFLIASITKPIVAMGVLKLVERGEVLLGTKLSEIIPEMGKKGFYGITLRHLLTHSSGLPDMLPNNLELRQANAGLDQFVKGIESVELEFPVGRNAAYSSMGFALLGEVIARVTGLSPRKFLEENFFVPLEMHDTSLGSPDEWYEGDSPQIERLVEIRVPESMQAGDRWNWNSRYWRSLGAPWGGLITSPADLGRYAQMLLKRGEFNGKRILSPASIELATSNQIEPLRDIPETVRRCKPWGLGWRLHWPAHSANFGDLLGPRTFGHWGATGTLLWIDPDAGVWCTILTTEPQEPDGMLIARLSNLISAALSEVTRG